MVILDIVFCHLAVVHFSLLRNVVGNKAFLQKHIADELFIGEN